MWYKTEDSQGELILSDVLPEDYFEEIQKTVSDGTMKRKETISFSEIGEKNLLGLNLFLEPGTNANSNQKLDMIFSVNEAIEKLNSGKTIYASGIYYSNNVRGLGRRRWQGPIHFMSGNDPNFAETDAQVLKIIRKKNKLELVLKCKTYSRNSTEKHRFTVVQAHF